MVAPNSEQVEYNIILKAAQALTELQKLNSQATSFKQKVDNVTAAVQRLSAQTGLSIKSVISVFKEADKSFSDMSGESALFGKLGKQGWNDVGQAAESNSKRVVRGVDAIRIALGVLVSMLIFQVIQVFQNVFRMAINNLRETELAVYNLINAERRLSEEGIDVTPKGLQETIDGLRKLVPILSQIQAEELVSRIATNVAPALKFDDNQIKQMSESIALLYVRNKALGYSFDEIEKAITDAFLTGKVSQGINKFGVKISDQIVKDEALRMGLVKTAEEFDNLTGEVEAQIKAQAMLSVVYNNATQDVGSLGEYMETTDAQIEKTKTTWSDLLTTLAKVFGPLLNVGLKVITNSLEIMLALLEAIKTPLQDFVAMWAAFVMTSKGKGFQTPLQSLLLFNTDEFSKNLEKVKKQFAELEDSVDTPTEKIGEFGEALEEVDFSEFENKIEDIIQDADNAREDLQTKVDRKLADIDEEYRRKALDAQTDYNRKIEDINRDAEQKKADALNKAREDDLKAERDYQNKLWELRMKYLMDLEEALHARDARQVLRLMKQYAFDKEALLRKKKDDDRTRAESLQADLQKIEIERQRKLADAQLEYEQKLADQRIAKQRELDDLEVWRRRELADIEEGIRRKMETLIQGWIQEGKITQAGAQQVYDILRSYFGPGGLTDQLYSYMMNSLLSNTALPASMSGAPAPYFNLAAAQANNLNSENIGGGVRPTGGRRGRGFAEGGTLLATRPMTATFGEVPEVVNFAPLSGGNNVGKMFGDKSASGGGMLELLLTLSPDLESRIVRKSMDNVADVIVKVNRSKS